MFDIITFGSATRDIIVSPKKLSLLKYEKDIDHENEVCFPIGSKIDIDQIYFASGGGGTNSAATFARQGFRTAFLGAVGKDIPGEEIIKELKDLRIDVKHVVRKKNCITNHSIVILNDGQDRTILAYRGAAEMVDINDIPFGKLKASWMYLAPLSGLLCLPAGRQATTPFEEIVDFARANGIKVAVNPGIAQLSLPYQILVKIFSKIDILIINCEEASFLTKLPPAKEQEIFSAIDSMCPGVVVMTKGGKGVAVSDNQFMYSAKPHENRKILDTTGAGDAFGSGFVAEFIKSGGNIERSIQFAMANAEGCISEIGANKGLLRKGTEFERITVNRSIL